MSIFGDIKSSFGDHCYYLQLEGSSSLSKENCDSISLLIKDFYVKAIISHFEQTIQNLYNQVANFLKSR